MKRHIFDAFEFPVSLLLCFGYTVKLNKELKATGMPESQTVHNLDDC